MNFFIKKDNKAKWSKEKPNGNVRTSAHKIIKKHPGNIGEAKNVHTPIGQQELQISEEMLWKVVDYTNIYITTTSENFQRAENALPASVIEIQAFKSLLYV